MFTLTDQLSSLIQKQVQENGTYNPQVCFNEIRESLSLTELVVSVTFLDWVYQNQKNFDKNINNVFNDFNKALMWLIATPLSHGYKIQVTRTNAGTTPRLFATLEEANQSIRTEQIVAQHHSLNDEIYHGPDVPFMGRVHGDFVVLYDSCGDIHKSVSWRNSR